MGSEEGACNPFGLNLSPIAEVTAGNKAALRVFSESSSVGNGDQGDTFGWRHPLVGILDFHESSNHSLPKSAFS